MTLSAADVGHRVVVRRVLAGETGPSGGPALTDVIGVLESWGEELAVRRRDGTLVVIRRADVVAGKRVPPPPPRRRSC